MRGGGRGRIGHFFRRIDRTSLPKWRGPAFASDIDDTGFTVRSPIQTSKIARFCVRKRQGPHGVVDLAMDTFHATLAERTLATSVGLIEMRQAAREMVGRLTPGQPASAPSRIVRSGKSLKGKRFLYPMVGTDAISHLTSGTVHAGATDYRCTRAQLRNLHVRRITQCASPSRIRGEGFEVGA